MDISSTPGTILPRRGPTLLELTTGSNKGQSISLNPESRTWHLIGPTDLHYRWEQYWKPRETLSSMKRPLRNYYERSNRLVQQYIHIDKLLESGIHHDLLQEYHSPPVHIDSLEHEEERRDSPSCGHVDHNQEDHIDSPSDMHRFIDAGDKSTSPQQKLKSERTTSSLRQMKKHDGGKTTMSENTPLLRSSVMDLDLELESDNMPPDLEVGKETGTSSPVVTRAIWINAIANVILLILKIVVVVLSSSVSVLASLVDGALDFLSTTILGLTTWLISRADQQKYPIGRRRLEPVGVLIFSVLMIAAFFQVLYQALARLASGDHQVVELTLPATTMMLCTVVIKGICWLWCRFVKNSTVQALAQDAVTDVMLNTFSIIFPLVGFYANLWWLDPLGGALLSVYVIASWSGTANEHICNLTSASASADERNVLLYLTMRFAKGIKHVQGLQAYHSGDKLNVEVDVVVDEGMSLRNSHDLGECLQHVIESLPNVDRAFVHMDYLPYNLPSHVRQDS